MLPYMAGSSTNSPRIFAVVLAAGEATRFGRTKQLVQLPGQDESLVRRASRLAAATCGERSLLVAGHDAVAVVAEAAAGCRFVAINERYADGLGSSVALAARALAHTADALLYLLADQPRISTRHLAGLCEAWTGNARHIVATSFGDSVGAPAILPRGTFDRLAELSDDSGASAVFDDDDCRLTTLRCDDAAVDIDTPGDLALFGQGVE